jgi:type VI protein secretion system component Hcp
MSNRVVGSRAEVMSGTAVKTSGGLTKNDLFLDPNDHRIKSKAKSNQAKNDPSLKAWRNAVNVARENMARKANVNVDELGFVPIKGNFLKEVRKHY